MSPMLMKLPVGLETEIQPANRADARDEGLKIVWRENQGALRADWRFAAFRTPAGQLCRRPDRPGA